MLYLSYYERVLCVYVLLAIRAYFEKPNNVSLGHYIFGYVCLILFAMLVYFHLIRVFFRIVQLKLKAKFDQHKRQITILRYLPKRNQLISVGNDNFIKVWNFSDGQCIATFQTKLFRVTCIELVINESVLVTGSNKSAKMKFYCLDQYNKLFDIDVGSDESAAAGVSSMCSISLSELAVGLVNGKICLYNPLTFRLITTLATQASEFDEINCLKYLSYEKLLVYSYENLIGFISLNCEDENNNHIFVNSFAHHTGQIKCLEYNESRGVLLSSSDKDNFINIWSINNKSKGFELIRKIGIGRDNSFTTVLDMKLFDSLIFLALSTKSSTNRLVVYDEPKLRELKLIDAFQNIYASCCRGGNGDNDDSALSCLELIQARHTLIAGYKDGMIKVWHI